jgi:hypothetical protein
MGIRKGMGEVRAKFLEKVKKRKKCWRRRGGGSRRSGQ